MIEFYTAATPNGWKVAIALEEMGLTYRVNALDLSAGEQKTDDYLKLNPNGRIPTIVDLEADGGPFTVFESGAILMYLAEKSQQLIPADPRGKSEALQWIMFQVGGLGPMMGQAAVFLRYAEERIEFAIGRYQRESMRLLEVLDTRLKSHEWLLGDAYSIADIAHWSWAHAYKFIELDLGGLPHLTRWIDRIAERPAVQRGMKVPAPVEVDEAEIKRRRKGLA